MVLHTMAWGGHRAQPLFAPLHNNRYVGRLPLGVCFSLPTLELAQAALRAANSISSSKRFSIPRRFWGRGGSDPPSVVQERISGHLGAVRRPRSVTCGYLIFPRRTARPAPVAQPCRAARRPNTCPPVPRGTAFFHITLLLVLATVLGGAVARWRWRAGCRAGCGAANGTPAPLLPSSRARAPARP